MSHIQFTQTPAQNNLEHKFLSITEGRVREYREPSLAPGGYVGDPTTVKNPLPGPSTSIILATIRPFPENAHAYVAQGRAEHGAVTFNVEAPPTISILQQN